MLVNKDLAFHHNNIDKKILDTLKIVRILKNYFV